MGIKKTPDEIWKEYQNGVSYNTQLELYDNFKLCNNFYNDKHWENIDIPDMDKPVFNFIKSIVKYFIAMMISDQIAADVTVTGAEDGEEVSAIIRDEIGKIIEREKLHKKNRKAIRNCAVDGDCCFYNWFDVEAGNGQVKGEIRTDIINNTNVIFADPSNPNAQEQKYIIIVMRLPLEDVQEEANKFGNHDTITADSDSLYMNDEKNTANKNYATVLLKMWKEKRVYTLRDSKGTPVKDSITGNVITKVKNEVHMIKCTEKTVVRQEWAPGYLLYPIGWMLWEEMKNSYHGVSPVVGMIQNQIFANKMYAMCMEFATRMAFPKLLYDESKIPGGWDNRIGKAIKVIGNPNDAFFASFAQHDMSASVPVLIDSVVKNTKDLHGAFESALGNVKPENTSAIIATQKQASMQLDIQRLDFYDCVEDIIRSNIHMMRVHYGLRMVKVKDAKGKETTGEFDFNTLENYTTDLKIDVGPGSYWSELVQIQTLDNLMNMKIIPDALTYLESIPDGFIRDKQGIIDKIKAFQGSGGIAGMAGVSSQVDGMVAELKKLGPDKAAEAISQMDIGDQEKKMLAQMVGQ